MSQQSEFIVETTLSVFQPYLDDMAILDQPLTFHHNGERGIHHALLYCGGSNYKNPFNSKSILTLQEVQRKRLCGQCLPKGIKIQLLNGGDNFDGLTYLDKELSRNIESFQNKLTVKKLLEHYNYSKTLDETLNNFNPENLQKEGLVNFSINIRERAQFYIELVNKNFFAQKENFEIYFALQNIESLASNDNYAKVLTSKESSIFSPEYGVFNRRHDAVTLFEIWFHGRSTFQTADEIKSKLRESLSTIKLSTPSQVKGYPVDPDAKDLEEAVNRGWEKIKLTALTEMYQRWEDLLTKELSKQDSYISLLYRPESWRAEEVKILLPFYSVSKHPSEEYLLVRVPEFISKWLYLQSQSFNYRYSNPNLVTSCRDKNYTKDTLDAALVLFDPSNEELYSDFSKAVMAASLI